MKFFIHICFIISMAASLWGQPKGSLKNYYIQPSLHYGFILPHIRSIEYMLVSHLTSIDVKLGTKSTEADPWNYLYRYPGRGFGYFVTGLGNKEWLGYGHALYSYINIPYNRKEGRFQWNYQMGLGFGYLTKKFDIEENLYNVAIGSAFNIYINFETDLVVKLTPRLNWCTGLNFSHFSNGKLKSPNLGLNIITLATGIKYYIHDYQKVKSVPEITEPENQNEFTVFLSGGIKSHDDLLSDMYFISSLSGDYHRIVSNKRKFGGGLDIFYDASIHRSLRADGKTPVKTTDLYRIGIHGSHEVMFKRLTLLMQLGHYVYYTYFELTNLYTRIGLIYDISEHWLARISLKAHMANADFMEWGMGYKF